MKIFNKFFVLPLLLLGFSCTTDSIDEVPSEENLSIEEQQVTTLEVILARGYEKSEIEDFGDYYLVQGDILFSKEKSYALNSNRQRHTPYITDRTFISVYLHPSMSSTWRNASRQAITRWNNLETNFHFVEITNSSADIQIMYDSSAGQTLNANEFGAALPPTSNLMPGNLILINPDFNACSGGITETLRIANVQHELGHTIGLAHTNDSSESYIPNTPYSDSNSIMQGGYACSLSDFSTGDIDAIQILFPPIFWATVNGPSHGYPDQNYTWTGLAYGDLGEPPYTYHWYRSIDEGETYTMTWGSTQSVYSYIPEGMEVLRLYLVVTDSEGNIAKKRFQTINMDFGGGGPKPGM
ncbi:Dual-action HEIGH metallo-peptidase [Zunongwangia mangrovi]|uniref:Dual-action HEIGH metallo-peptidase n=1 Tax=Zunongwangia mangrovi TaxID=1334022 RepID=A0A1I1DAF2_9FLAO|nr:M57 family metalloprotease [Zunongwangia mangrovi]SFB71989.1 Dual-action HEIGH metallo-peptidase [Zunongwangia mangrovi]